MITTTPKSASDKIKARTTEQLISDFEATNDKAPSIDPEQYLKACIA